MGNSLIGRDDDPALSIYGIEQATKLAEKEKNSERFKMPRTPKGELVPIAVSGLIRTWETAVLLYGYQPENQKEDYIDIQLRICPWLRETAGTKADIFDVGNTPEKLKHSVPKFIKFLNKLITNKSINIYDTQDAPIGKYNVGNPYKIGTVTIYIPPANTSKNELPSNGTWQEIKISLDRDTQQYSHTNLCLKNSNNPDGIIDTVYEYYGYQKEVGDIMEFMSWYTAIFPNIITPIVHIVAHSQIMQAFAKTRKELEHGIAEENCWSMTILYHPRDGAIHAQGIIRDVKHGFDKPTKKIMMKNGTTLLKKAKDTEKSEQNGARPTSLCGKSGLVEEISCASGGRRKRSKRRKRSYRKKTRRYRR